jgi:hypothetical protein
MEEEEEHSLKRKLPNLTYKRKLLVDNDKWQN